MAPEALLQGFSHIPGVEVHVVSCLQEKVRSPEKLAPNIWYHALHVPKIGWMRTGYQGCVRAVRRKLQEIQPDIVHSQGTERDCAITGVFSGFPAVLTIHGNLRLVAKLHQARVLSFLGIQSRLEQYVLPKFRGVVCITNYTRDAVIKDAKRTWLLPNAVDEKFFEVTRAVPLGPKRLLVVGNIDARKNQLALIRALDGASFLNDIEVRFFGGDSAPMGYGQEFKTAIAGKKWYHFGGFLNRTQLREEFSQASGLILPSLEDNCPMVVLEAMAARVPVAAANVGGVPDLVEDGLTGLLMNPTERTSMKQTIERLVKDEDGAVALAKNARKRAEERFRPSIIAKRHIDIYREALGR